MKRSSTPPITVDSAHLHAPSSVHQATSVTVSGRTFDASRSGMRVKQLARQDDCAVDVYVSDARWRHSTIATVTYHRPMPGSTSIGVTVSLYDFAFTFRTDGSGRGGDNYSRDCSDSPTERPTTATEARADAACAARVASARVYELLRAGSIDPWGAARAGDMMRYIDHALRVD